MNLDKALDELAWCASNVRHKRWGSRAERALGMVALKLTDNLGYDDSRKQDEAFEKLMQRWDRIAKEINAKIEASVRRAKNEDEGSEVG